MFQNGKNRRGDDGGRRGNGRREIDREIEQVLLQQQAILDNAVVGLAYLEDGVFAWANGRLHSLLGYERDELFGFSAATVFFSEEDWDDISGIVGRSAADRQVFSVERWMRGKDGSPHWVRNAGHEISEDGTKNAAIWVVEYDSARKRDEERLNRENRLRNAIERGELVLHFQPKVELRRGSMIGVEALVRWQCPEEGLIPPDRFIGLAEETGLILALGDWVLQTACSQAKAWLDAGFPALRMAVNMSPRQLNKPTLLADIVRVLENTGLPPDALELEITESSLMQRTTETLTMLRDLREMGIRVSADDFGTGYSSLSYLHSLPLDGIKIDRSFVTDVGAEEGHVGTEGLVAAVIGIGQSFNLEVVAEGVETDRQLGFLRQQWCDQIQGFLFSRPLPASEFENLMRETRRL